MSNSTKNHLVLKTDNLIYTLPHSFELRITMIQDILMTPRAGSEEAWDQRLREWPLFGHASSIGHT